MDLMPRPAACAFLSSPTPAFGPVSPLDPRGHSVRFPTRQPCTTSCGSGCETTTAQRARRFSLPMRAQTHTRGSLLVQSFGRKHKAMVSRSFAIQIGKLGTRSSWVQELTLATTPLRRRHIAQPPLASCSAVSPISVIKPTSRRRLTTSLPPMLTS